MRKLFVLVFSLISMTRLYAQDSIVLKKLSPVPQKVNGSTEVKTSLNGTWYFNPAPEKNAENSTAINKSWAKIEVPGEWVMQGFTVVKNAWAGYARSFDVPSAWKDMRVKLRCDAVYSESEIYINGKKAGYHLGGFTPFEFDITDFIKPGAPSSIYVKVRNESIADSLASGSQYAVHALGGITRKISLVAVPEVNISSFHAVTTFDKEYKNAVLKAEIQLSNDGKNASKKTKVSYELLSAGSQTIFSKTIDENDIINAGTSLNRSLEFPVDNPRKWDPEHPNLYTFRATVHCDGKTETVERKIGFRQIEIKGNVILVNNMPVKLRGACRHEVSPLRGRSLTSEQWVNDVLIFREENVNYIRTSHYPPPEELVTACDSLGMFLEVEAPFCWADQTKVPDALYQSAIIDQTLDMVNFFRSNPSVLDWSLANESQGAYKTYFRKSGELVKKLDPTRPRNYNQYGDEGDNGELELYNLHYPGPGGPSKYQHSSRPVIFGEYAHLNAYNRLELVTDPGIRDAWGIGFKNMWEKMYNTKAIAGGAIWAAIDDTFILPDGKVVGYGTWGPVDGWRRRKPEFWHVKKTYSPVKIQLVGNYKNDSVQLLLENRLLFSDLSECRMQWRAGKYSGSIQSSALPGTKTTASIKINGTLTAADTMYIDVYDPRNVLIDQYAFAVVPAVNETDVKQKSSGTIKYTNTPGEVVANAGDVKIMLNKQNGNIELSKNSSTTPFMQLSKLLLLPLNGEGRGTQMTGKAQVFDPFTNTCANRIIKKIDYNSTQDKFLITVHEDYDEASGYVRYEFTPGKDVQVTYRYTINKDINPRQWGIVVALSDDFNTLSWKRTGLWNYYPEDHIGRSAGTATAQSPTLLSGPAGPVKIPSTPWKDDRNELGSNDFRSTKMNITAAAVQGANNDIKVTSNGSQHIRAWKESKSTNLLIAGYSNLGSEGFFRGHAEKFDRPLKQGDVIEDSIHFSIQ